jgi:hypothetical protein
MASWINDLRQLSTDDFINILLALPIKELINLCRASPGLRPLCGNWDFWADKAATDFNFPPEIFVKSKSKRKNPWDQYIDILTANDPNASNFQFEEILRNTIKRDDIDLLQYWLTTPKFQNRIPLEFTPMLTEAASNGNIPIIQLLLDYAKTHITYPVSESIDKAIRSASGRGQLKAVQYLQAATRFKPNIKQLNDDLDVAARSGNLELVRHFIDMGATDIHKALITAAVSNKINVVRYLMGLGPIDPNNVLREVARYRSLKPEIVQEFINAGATNPDEVISIEIQHGFFDIIKGLLDLGIRPRTSSYPRNPDWGRYHSPEVKRLSEALLRAFENVELPILAFISASGAKNINEALIMAAQADRRDVVQFLLNHGVLADKSKVEIIRLINQAIAAASERQADSWVIVTLLLPITGQANFNADELRDYVALAKYMTKTNNVVLSEALEDAVRDGRLDIVKILVRTPLTQKDLQNAVYRAYNSDHDNIADYLSSVLEGATKLDYNLPYLTI